MNLTCRTNIAVCTVAAAALLSAGVVAAQAAKAPPSTSAAAKAMEDTGQHRGFTNDKLFLQPDDGKEMTFVVEIAGDKERKWQKDFATGSRITVTYVSGAGGGAPIATSLKQAADAGKK